MTGGEPSQGVVPETDDPLLVLERMDEGFYAIDREWRFRFVNRSAELFWGRERGELLGHSMLETFSRFAGSPAHAAHVKAMTSGASDHVETISTATGAPVELRLFPSADGLSVYFHDITKRRQMEEDLRTREELLTLAELSAGIGVWVSDLPSQTMIATPQFFKLHGLEPQVGPVPQSVPRQVRHPEDALRLSEGFRQALDAGQQSYESEYRIVRPNGDIRWIFGRGRVTRDSTGTPWKYSGVDIDITERKQAEDHLRMVMRELLHRTNNLLAVVQGLARQTASGSADLTEFTATFSARLKGLGESSALLAKQDWRGALLADLIGAQVSSFAAIEKFELSGPKVLLSPRAVQNLGLALHELCTNAIKYGALSRPKGKVVVTWDIQHADGGPRLHLSWKEQDGPRVTAPVRSGFGRVVAEQMVASALNAEVATRFAPDGIEWTIDLPSDAFTVQAG